MTNKLLILPLLTIISACTWNDEIIYKEGISINQYKSDLLECKIDSLNKIPQKIIVEINPITTIPEKEVCIEKKSEDGLEIIKECTKTGGGVAGGEEISRDINEALRNDYLNNCINVKGYTKVILPVCEREQVRSGYGLSEYAPLDRVTPNSCVVTNDSETGWVINP